MRERHPHVGNLILAIRDEPQSVRAWDKGALGEERVGAHLERLTEIGAVVLHDRQVPGSVANIDHIVVTPSGVWVVDAKHYRGRVEPRQHGNFFRNDVRLHVGGRDCSKIAEATHHQVDIVAREIDDDTVFIRPVLCFTGAEWGLLANPFTVDGVLVTWPRALNKTITRAKPLDVDVRQVAARLANRLKPAR